MARLSYEEYLQLEQQREEKQNKTKIRFLSLKNDGDEAIVRFAYTSPSELKIDSVHSVKLSNGSYRKINCLRNAYEPLSKCPLCNNDNKSTSKIFVLLLEYTQDEGGNIIAVPSIWERPVSYVKVLRSYMEEYGDISDMIFKIKRVGAAGNLQTTYNTLPVNMSIYKPEIYKKDFTEFDNYSLIGHAVLSKTYEEMVYFLESGDFPQTTPSGTQGTSGLSQQYTEPQHTQVVDTQKVYTPQNSYQNNEVKQTSQTENPNITKPRRYTY